MVWKQRMKIVTTMIAVIATIGLSVGIATATDGAVPEPETGAEALDKLFEVKKVEWNQAWSKCRGHTPTIFDRFTLHNEVLELSLFLVEIADRMLDLFIAHSDDDDGFTSDDAAIMSLWLLAKTHWQPQVIQFSRGTVMCTPKKPPPTTTTTVLPSDSSQ